MTQLCRKCFAGTLVSALLLSALPLNAQDTATGWPHLKYAIYFVARDIDSLLGDSARFKKTMDYFAPVKPVRAYLEAATRGDIDTAMFRKVSARFKAIGMKATGAMIAAGEHGPLTYNNPADLAALEKRMRALASVFDDIILDDWLFTTATDAKSVEDRGAQTWAEYRTKLIIEQSKKYIIAPARQVNPKVVITIKYPNWYEGFGDCGYDVYSENQLFDKIAVGIETRNRMNHDQHIPIYSGYVFQKWYTYGVAAKWEGSWLDNWGMKDNWNDFNAQVWQAVLAQSPEIILWCGGHLYTTGPWSNVFPHFRDMLPQFDRVAGMLSGAARGVPIYLPWGSTGEYNIFGYLGMAGIPLTPVAQFPTESKNAIFTLHSLRDPKLADEMLARLRNGKDVFMTWELWKSLRNTEFKNTINLVAREGTVTTDRFRFHQPGSKQDIVKAGKALTFQCIETTTWPYVRDVAAVRDDCDCGVLLDVPYLNGKIYVLNMPGNNYDLLRLPAGALNAIRRAFSGDLGMELEGAGGVGMYLFGDKQYALYNMSDTTSAMTLSFPSKLPTSGWLEAVSKKALVAKQDSTKERPNRPATFSTAVSVTLKPFDIAVVQMP